MGIVKDKFKSVAIPMADEVKNIIKDHGDKQLDTVSISQAYGGMRDIMSMVVETSLLDPIDGIRFRGYSIPELHDKLPKAEGSTEPLPEGIFYLMLTGELPTEEVVKHLGTVFAKRSVVPKHVFDVLDALPIATHPMTQFTTAIMAMQTESLFAKAYRKGMSKKDYWDYTFEDSMNLIARLPRVAAYIYIEPDHYLDWGANFAHMLGYEQKEFHYLMHLYLTIHADHEGGNLSAHTVHCVGSGLSDPYLAFAAGMNALAGPLHGLANQEVIRWIQNMQAELGGGVPSKQQIADYVNKTMAEGKVVPGYGHAVLRRTDPRFTAQMEFAKKYMPHDELVNIVWAVYDVVPEILGSKGKIKNPWPNVDAHSGALLVHYGLVENDYYTVLFGVSRALGVLAQLCWSRALSLPIERPKSVTTEWIKDYIKNYKS